jgi:signal transduction histidine kinase
VLHYLFCSLTLTAYAQPDSTYRDSLLVSLNDSKQHDTLKLKTTSLLYQYYFNTGDNQSSLLYCKMALALATEANMEKKVARIMYSIGLNYTTLTRYDSARFYLDEAQKLAIKVNDLELAAHIHHANALWLSYKSDFSSAVEHLMQCADIIEKNPGTKFKLSLGQVYCELGYNLISENQIENGIAYELKALSYKNYPDELRYRLLIFLNLTDGYVKLKKLREAGHYLDSALIINRALQNNPLAILTANTQGFYYQNVNHNAKALEAYRLAYKLADSVNNKTLKAESGDNISRILYSQKKYAEAEQFAREASRLATSVNAFKAAASTYELLKILATQKGNHREALGYAELHKMYADSATNATTQKLTLSLESKYRHQKRENEIMELKALNAEHELAVTKRNKLLITGGLVAAVLVLALLFLYRNSKQKRIIAEKEQTLQQEQIKFLERQQKIVSLQSMINGQETERTRIAKDLHDGLGGLFSTVKMYFSTLEYENEVLKSNELFKKSFALVDNASIEVRRVAHNMMPEVLMKLGLINAIRDLCNNITSGKLLTVSFEVFGFDKRLNASTEIMLYRIIQELLNNIIKHARATEAIVQFTRDDENRLTVVVEDNGQGFNTLEADEKTHMGIETIKSRVHYLNGKLTIDSQRNVGTTVTMEFLIHE